MEERIKTVDVIKYRHCVEFSDISMYWLLNCILLFVLGFPRLMGGVTFVPEVEKRQISATLICTDQI